MNRLSAVTDWITPPTVCRLAVRERRVASARMLDAAALTAAFIHLIARPLDPSAVQ
ncbi:hypothetical protein [Brevibacterium senegalense]|uniref:hypothetical protein n=1 Tax=Brevibacterium senegalense TaxID=1033736 RepID=UPI001375B492|nr:hypothetical protein [Brevibacterium senegalense]